MTTRGRHLAVAVAIVFTAAMLRSPIVAVAPVAGDIQSDLDITAGTVGLLTSIPILCFSVCTPIAVWLIRRGGADIALTAALGGSVLGCLIRSSGDLGHVLVGTAVMGLFLTIGNVVVPVIIAREYPPERMQAMTALYTSALNVGTMTVTLATAPIAAGTGWRFAIGVWAWFGLVALVVWVALVRARAVVPATAGGRGAAGRVGGGGAAGDSGTGSAARGSAGRSAATWWLTAAFAGQAFAFVGATAWLPSILADQGFSAEAAGAIAAIFQIGGVAGALVTPFVAGRWSLSVALVLTATAWAVLSLGFLLAPAGWAVWCAVGGLAQGAGVTWVFIMFNALGGGPGTTASRSGIVQGFGYAVAAFAPVILGSTHEATGAWTLPLTLLLASAALLGIAGWRAAAPLRR